MVGVSRQLTILLELFHQVGYVLLPDLITVNLTQGLLSCYVKGRVLIFRGCN